MPPFAQNAALAGAGGMPAPQYAENKPFACMVPWVFKIFLNLLPIRSILFKEGTRYSGCPESTMTNTVAVELGSRVRAARERMRLSQQKLADEIGWKSAQIVSTVESGERELKAWELARIARVLHTPFESLLNTTASPEPIVLWRAKPLSEEVAAGVEARFLQRCTRYSQLEEWCGVRAPKELKPLSMTSLYLPVYSVESEAENVRDAMKLGGRPACTLEKTLEEDYGVKIFHEDLGPDGSALCAQGEKCGPAICLNSSEAPWRQNYSLAHELFHLMTPGEMAISGEKCERLANAFASALLLPQESLTNAIRARLSEKSKITFEKLVEIASEFGVSIDALCWRLVNLGMITKEVARTQLQQGSKLRQVDQYGRREQVRTTAGPGLPDRYTRLAYLAYAKGKIGRSKLAEYLEISAYDLAVYINSHTEAIAGAETEIAVAGC